MPDSSGTSASQEEALASSADAADAQFSSEPVDATASSCLTYIDITVVDEEGQPVADHKYRLVLTDGSAQNQNLPDDGHILVESIPHGTCDFMLFKTVAFSERRKSQLAGSR